MGSMRLTGPMKAVLTEALERAMRTPEGETLYQVDALGVWRTVGALQRRGLVVMEARTVLDGLGRAYQAFTSWLTEEGVKVTEKLRGPVVAPWAVAGVRARTTAGKGKIIDRFVHGDGIERVTFVPDGARAGDALPIDVRDPHLAPESDEAQQGVQEPQERPTVSGGAQGAGEVSDGAQGGVCTHPSECDAPAVGSVRAVKRATGEGGIVGVFCSVHLVYPSESFPGGYVFEYLTVDGRGALGAPGPLEGVTGTEGDPVWVARRDAALGVLAGLLDGGAVRYRRTVLTRRVGVRGMSDIMSADVARTYLAEEVADGGSVEANVGEPGVVLTRENGARLLLESVESGRGQWGSVCADLTGTACVGGVAWRGTAWGYGAYLCEGHGV